MSLGKLLATGRSLVGGAPDAGRYDISSRNRLPKFGSAKNPFAPSATSEARVADVPPERLAPLGEQPVLEGTPTLHSEKPLTPVLAPSDGEREETSSVQAQPVRHEETQRIPELADQPFGRVREHALISAPLPGTTGPNRLKAGLQTGAGLAMGGLKSFWRVTRTGAVAAVAAARGFKWGSGLTGLAGRIRRTGPLGRAAWGKMKFIFARLAGVFRKPEPKSVIPRFGKPAVQTELSLDRVKVVRNSLEDSDLEVVTADTATSTQVAPTTPVASPKRGPVPPALKKMTERLLGVPALD